MQAKKYNIMQPILNDEDNKKVHMMVHRILGQLLSEKNDIGVAAMLNLIICACLEKNVSKEEFLEAMSTTYDHYKKMNDDEK